MRIPDYRVVLDHDPTNPDAAKPELDLSETIDALLGAIDESCAPFEGKPDPVAESDAPVSDSGVVEAAEAAEATTDETEQDDVAQDALEAMDAVEENAEALLGETIDELLGDLPDVDSGETEEAVEAVEADIAEETEVEAEAVVDEAVEEALEEVADEIASEDTPDAESSSDEELIDSINDDLVSEIEAEDLSAAILNAEQSDEDRGKETDESTVDPIAEIEEALDIAEGESVEADGAVSDAIDDEVIDGIMESGADEEAAPDSVVPESTTAADEVDEVIQDIAEEIAQENVAEAEITSEDDKSNESDESDIADAIDAALDELDVDLSDTADETPVDEVVEAVEEVAEEADEEADVVSEIESAVEAVETVEEASSETTSDPIDDLGLDDLDAALAGIGDDLLMGDFEDADGELIDSSSLEDSIDPAMLLDQLNIPDTLPSDDEASESAAGEQQAETGEIAEAEVEAVVETPEVEQADSSADTQAEASTDTQAEIQADDQELKQAPTQASADPAAELKAPEANTDHGAFADGEFETEGEQDQVIESIWQTALRVSILCSKKGLDLLITHAGPVAARGVLMLSKPLASKPAHVRDSIGYIAIWTVFLASILLGYSIFFKTTPVPTPNQAPTRVLEPGESLEPIEHQMNEAPAP